jgi:hypothetical protein
VSDEIEVRVSRFNVLLKLFAVYVESANFLAIKRCLESLSPDRKYNDQLYLGFINAPWQIGKDSPLSARGGLVEYFLNMWQAWESVKVLRPALSFQEDGLSSDAFVLYSLLLRNIEKSYLAARVAGTGEDAIVAPPVDLRELNGYIQGVYLLNANFVGMPEKVLKGWSKLEGLPNTSIKPCRFMDVLEVTCDISKNYYGVF